jgi:DNA-binding NarL/FixJ family response regulator
VDHEGEITQLRTARRLRDEAAEAQKAATTAMESAVVAALRAGMKPTEITAEAEVSDSHVRALRRKHNIPADPRYAHLKPPVLPKDDSSQI